MWLKIYAVTLNIIEQHSPPDNVHLSSVDSRSLTFSWNPVNSSCHTALAYGIASRSCGICPNITTDTFATCVNVPVDGSVCLFQVQTTVCNDNHGPLSLSTSVTVTLTGDFIITWKIVHIYWQHNFVQFYIVPVVSQVKTVPCFSVKGKNFTAIQVSFNETVCPKQE